ncbi:MAG: PIN domain-containing protein [Saprospiraceae bacterium]
MKNDSPIIAVLDACILYPAPLRDLLLYIADASLFQPKWSDQINEEWVRNLLKNRSNLKRKGLDRTVKEMNRAFADANVNPNKEEIEILVLPDLDDRHVLATAIKAKAERIITANLKDFPPTYIQQFKISVQHPDKFIHQLINDYPNEVLIAFRKQVGNLKNPPRTELEVIESLKKCGLTNSSLLLKQLILET